MTTMGRFSLGDLVVYFPDGNQDRGSGAGVFRIQRLMPEERSGPSYKIIHSENGHERIAREYQLELAESQATTGRAEVIAPPSAQPKRSRRKALQPLIAALPRSSLMAIPHGDAQIEQVMATVRRIRAAVSASEEGVADDAVVGEILKMLQSDGMRNLLANSEPSIFVGVISSVSNAVAEVSSSAEILCRLRVILGSQGLTVALATDDPEERPARLLQLMMDGPFKNGMADPLP